MYLGEIVEEGVSGAMITTRFTLIRKRCWRRFPNPTLAIDSSGGRSPQASHPTPVAARSDARFSHVAYRGFPAPAMLCTGHP